jgi:hypothetical protein
MLGPEGGRNGVAARQGIEFTYVHAALEIDGRHQGRRGALQRQRVVHARAGQRQDLAQGRSEQARQGQRLAGLTTINFQNNITDIGWMNEVLAYQLYRDAGSQAPRTSYAKVFLDSMMIVKDFWAEPDYAQLLLAMQKRTHDYVVAGKGTPQEALDGLVKDWTEVFVEDGKLKN